MLAAASLTETFEELAARVRGRPPGRRGRARLRLLGRPSPSRRSRAPPPTSWPPPTRRRWTAPPTSLAERAAGLRDEHPGARDPGRQPGRDQPASRTSSGTDVRRLRRDRPLRQGRAGRCSTADGITAAPGQPRGRREGGARQGHQRRGRRRAGLRAPTRSRPGTQVRAVRGPGRRGPPTTYPIADARAVRPTRPRRGSSSTSSCPSDGQQRPRRRRLRPAVTAAPSPDTLGRPPLVLLVPAVAGRDAARRARWSRSSSTPRGRPCPTSWPTRGSGTPCG